MKFIENTDPNAKFKFNPCAVPFVPSVQRNKKILRTENGAVTMKAAFHGIDAEQMCWSSAFHKPDLQVYSDLILMQGDDFMPSCFSNGNDTFWKVRDLVGEQKNGRNRVDISKWRCFPELADEYRQSPEISCQDKLSAWLQDECFYDGPRGEQGGEGGGSSVCDENWSATPGSSTSPPPNEGHDRSSISYGSFPWKSLFSHLTSADSRTNLSTDLTQETPNDSEASQSQAEDSETGSDVSMRYYSPFGTGVSSWLAGRNGRQRDSLQGREEEIEKVADAEVGGVKTGNVWNDETSGDREPRKTWMRQSTVDESDDSLFVGTGLVDDDPDEPVELPCWEFSSAFDGNLWHESTGTRKESLSNESWIGSHPESKQELFPGKFRDDLIQQLKSSLQNLKSSSMDRRKLELTGRSSGIGLGNKSQSSFPQRSYTPKQAFHGSNTNGLEGLQEQMLHMAQLRPNPFNPGAIPFFFIPGAPVYGDGNTYPMLNPYQFQQPVPSLLNCDYHPMLGQFYAYPEQTAFVGMGGKNYPSAQVARHTGPALELHQRLDQCYEQFRHLENERKKAEAELARQNPGKLMNSDNNLVVPPMPPNPSRIDRLIVEDLREHGRVVTLAARMEQLRGARFRPSLLSLFEYWLDAIHKLQACRKNEIINRKKYRLESHGALQKEKDVLALADALSDLAVSIQKVRTAIWCALQLVSTDLPGQCIKRAYSAARRSHVSSVAMHTALEEAVDETGQGSDCEDDYRDDEIDQLLANNGYGKEMLNEELASGDEMEEEKGFDGRFQERGDKSDHENCSEAGIDCRGEASSEKAADCNQLHNQLADECYFTFPEEPNGDGENEDYGSGKEADYEDYGSGMEADYDDYSSGMVADYEDCGCGGDAGFENCGGGGEEYYESFPDVFEDA